MQKLESLFHESLSDRYPRGVTACCFYPDRLWHELCHLMPQTKVNRKACHTLWGIPDLIDLPLINVMPGSRYANHEGYTTQVSRCAWAVVVSARAATLEWLSKKKIDLDVICATVQPVCDLFHGCNFLADVLKAQERFQYCVRNSHRVANNA